MNTLVVNTSIGSVAVHQNGKDGFPIIFVHGSSLSCNTFIHQLNDKTLNEFRLIAFDLPGHGDSFRSTNPKVDYSPFTFIKCVVELCELLRAGNGALVGHSLGGHIAIDALNLLPNIKGLVVFGTTPFTMPPLFEKAFLPSPLLNLIFKPDLSDDEMLKMAKGFVAENGIVPDEILESIRKSDPLVRQHIGEALNSGNLLDEVKIISEKKPPFLVIHGEKYQLINANYFQLLNKKLLWENKIQYIPNSGHSPQIESPYLFNKTLLHFTESIVK